MKVMKVMSVMKTMNVMKVMKVTKAMKHLRIGNDGIHESHRNHGATWWPELELWPVAPPSGQNWNYGQWCHLVAKIGTLDRSVTKFLYLEHLRI